ncbi:MAG: acyltransferase [Halanaerobiales bacterium]|nr:acyltransferase [Halanaerobiales bacterium]
MPSLRAKVWLIRLIRVKVGKNTAFGLMSMVDVFWPELITIGENCIVGYDSVILCHEFLVNEWRIGPVEIGRDVLIGANSTILAGVKIGDGAIIGAGTVVHKDVPPGAFVIGSPMQIKERGKVDE